MKKTITMLLALAMALSLLAGCSGSGNGTGGGNHTIGNRGGSNGSGDAAPSLISGAVSLDGDLSEHWLCKEKQTLKILTYDGANSAYRPPSNDLWFWKTLEDYTNVHIDWEISPISGYDEVLNTRLSAGVDLADIVMSTSARATTNAGNNGIFVDMAPYWDSCFKNTQNYFDTIGADLKSYITNPNDQIYALPNTFNPTEGHITFIYNTQWLKELGAEVPKTLDDFTALMYKMKEAGDLNHNGFNDEVILTSANITNLMSVMGNAFNLEIYEGWEAFDADNDGEVFPEYTSQNMQECLRYLNTLYKDGILDNEISYMSADDMGEKIANDRVGCFVFYSGFAVSYGMLTTAGQADPMGEHYTLGLPLASKWNNNEGYFVSRTLAYGNTGASITAECKDPELAAKWLDVLYADPTILWARVYGKENETWKYGADGKVELIPTGAGGQWDPYYLGVGQIALPFIQTTEEMAMDARQWYLDECEQIRQCKWIDASIPKVSIFDEDEAELRDEVNSETTAYWLEWRDKFITGLVDIDADWNTYVGSINGVGMSQLTEVWRMVYNRTKK